MTLIGALLALGIGVVLGLVGGGGSILTQPVLHKVIGLSAESAIVLGYPIVAVTALVGALRHLRAGTITLTRTVPMGFAAMLGAWLGTTFVDWAGITGGTRIVLLAITMIVAGSSLLRDVIRDRAPIPADRHPVALLLAGVGFGVLTGVVGVGGGFLMVPALVLLGGFELRQAVGSSLVIISMSTALAFLLQGREAPLAWDIGLPFLALTIVGMLGSSALVHRVPVRPLRGAFALTLLLVGMLLALPSMR